MKRLPYYNCTYFFPRDEEVQEKSGFLLIFGGDVWYTAGMETVSASGMVDRIFLRCVEDCFEPIMLTDRVGRLTYVNPAWVLTYGYSKEEAIGNTPRLLRSSNQNDDFYKSMWSTILDPAVGFWRGEVLNRAKDGHLVPVLLTITPYRESSGAIVGYMGIAVDLSDQKKMEHQILHQDRLASIGMLAGGLAHEIGNPLGVIRGRTELVMKQVQGNEPAEKSLEIIIGQIDRISGLIQSLLRASRAPERTSLGDVKLQKVVGEVLILVGEECRRLGIDLKTKDLDRILRAEPSHLQQVFLNTVINSLNAIEEQKKNSAASGKPHVIEVSAVETSDGGLRVSVVDSGIGIRPENQSRIFQPFFTTKEPGKGTGLGLAIVTKLSQEMGAVASVTSPGLGLGATFTLEFSKGSWSNA